MYLKQRKQHLRMSTLEILLWTIFQFFAFIRVDRPLYDHEITDVEQFYSQITCPDPQIIKLIMDLVHSQGFFQSLIIFNSFNALHNRVFY